MNLVAARLVGGHADNALPHLATANVNCRILPGVSPDAVKDVWPDSPHCAIPF
ncbi:MAG: peptidase dimerization domain-containing protein [Steroidobacteraceae bacterium]